MPIAGSESTNSLHACMASEVRIKSEYVKSLKESFTDTLNDCKKQAENSCQDQLMTAFELSTNENPLHFKFHISPDRSITRIRLQTHNTTHLPLKVVSEKANSSPPTSAAVADSSNSQTKSADESNASPFANFENVESDQVPNMISYQEARLQDETLEVGFNQAKEACICMNCVKQRIEWLAQTEVSSRCMYVIKAVAKCTQQYLEWLNASNMAGELMKRLGIQPKKPLFLNERGVEIEKDEDVTKSLREVTYRQAEGP